MRKMFLWIVFALGAFVLSAETINDLAPYSNNVDQVNTPSGYWTTINRGLTTTSVESPAANITYGGMVLGRDEFMVTVGFWDWAISAIRNLSAVGSTFIMFMR